MRLINAIVIVTVSSLTSICVAKTPAQTAQELHLTARELRSENNFQEACAYFKQAYAVYPAADIASDYAYTATLIGDVETAQLLYKAVVAQYPHLINIVYNLAHVLKMGGKLDEAITLYNYIIERNPNHEQARLGLSFAYLDTADFVNGWNAHAWHQKFRGLYAQELRSLLHNNNITGKTILLRPEGGLGDTLLFIRFAQLLKEQGAIINAMVQKPLYNLLSHCSFIDLLIPTDTPEIAIPPYDAQATYMSLPSIMQLNDTQMAPHIPYLQAEPELVEQWKEKLMHDTNFKIGISWQVDAHNDLSRMPVAQRALPLSLFAQLAEIPGVSLYSLQQMGGLDQIPAFIQHHTLHTFEGDFDKSHGAFVDTAALMCCLDLVISVDSAIEHLAGGLGKPIWILLAFDSDWRWFKYRHNDTPWYPTARLFRQPKPFDWNSVMHSMAQEIQQLVAQKKELV